MESSTHPDTSLPGSSYVIERDTVAVEMVQQLSSQKEKDDESDTGNIIVVSRTESTTNLDEQDNSKPKRRV